MQTGKYFPMMMDKCNLFSYPHSPANLPEREKEEFLPGSRLCSAYAYKQGITKKGVPCIF